MTNTNNAMQGLEDLHVKQTTENELTLFMVNNIVQLVMVLKLELMYVAIYRNIRNP